eukprot:11909557-Heterocapsa_arctica.AAC.1
MVHELVNLPLHEVLLDRRVAGCAYREEPWAVSVEHQPALHADDARMGPALGRRVVVQRADQVVTCPPLTWRPVVPDEDAQRRSPVSYTHLTLPTNREV